VHQISKIDKNLSFYWVSLAGGLHNLSQFNFLCLLGEAPPPYLWPPHRLRFNIIFLDSFEFGWLL